MTTPKLTPFVPAVRPPSATTSHSRPIETWCWTCQRPLIRQYKGASRYPGHHYCSRACWNTAHALRQMHRIWSQVAQDGECWIWQGTRDALGYARLKMRRHSDLLHRAIYVMTRGPIPEHLVLDHRCRRPPCLNPAHLEPVPQRVNVFRGQSPIAKNRQKTHCPQGHAYTPENTWISRTGGRGCRACNRERASRRLQAERELSPTKNTIEQDRERALLVTQSFTQGCTRHEIAQAMGMSTTSVDRFLRYQRFVCSTGCMITQRQLRFYWQQFTDERMRTRDSAKLALYEEMIFQRIAEHIRLEGRA